MEISVWDLSNLVMAYGPVYPRANRPATARAGPCQKKARRAEPVRAVRAGLSKKARADRVPTPIKSNLYIVKGLRGDLA